MANKCTWDDLEVVYKGIQEVWSVIEDGYPGDLRETNGDNSEFDYYHCHKCGQDWTETSVQTEAQAWELAKEHLR